MLNTGAPDHERPPPTETEYTGRFAPSPTGPLHMGSLVAALASYLDARANQGKWLLRMEDLDPPREQAGASDLILRQLETLCLYWDGDVLYQSTRHAAYRQAIEQLHESGKIYYCTCSRQQLKPYQGRYPGFCRGRKTLLPNAAVRCRVEAETPCHFHDLFQGEQRLHADRDGDFVIVRRDGLFAYQLAVVIDDAFQGITHVIRGIDLLDSTPKQIHLQKLLGLPQPVYGHLPVLTDNHGDKLSKQQGAQAISLDDPAGTLLVALSYLGLKPETQIRAMTTADILAWATEHWHRDLLAGKRALSYREAD